MLRYDALLGGAAVAAYFGLIALVFWKVRSSAGDQDGVLQVRPSEEGYGMRTGLGHVKLLPWTDARAISFGRNAAGRLELEIRATTVVGVELRSRIRVQFERVPLEQSLVSRTLHNWHARAQLGR